MMDLRETAVAGALCLVFALAARGQDVDAQLGTDTQWQHYSWIAPADSLNSGIISNGQLTATSGQTITDPFATVTQDAIWQQDYGVTYTQPLLANVALTYQTSAVTLSESSSSPTSGTPDDLSHQQKAGLQFTLTPGLTLGGNVYDASDDAGSPDSSLDTHGGGFSAQQHLPFNSVLTLTGSYSESEPENSTVGLTSSDEAYDAQFQQPLGKLPLTATLKGHYEESQSGGVSSDLPSLEQSLTWKPSDNATVQVGLRQQHYQQFPGVDNQLNQAVFADWAQTLIPEVTWHSYAEVLDTAGTRDVAPAAPIASGANGTAQSDDPSNNMGLPSSFRDESLTFSTGPSFKLQQDISASVEYSDRVNNNPAPGDAPQEQRVSVSVKGTF